ncbi:hypothetical protein V8E52_011920 [Russula decolorans]
MTQPSVHELYQRLETIGKGSYGSVHKGIHRATGNVVALKIIDLDADDADDVDSIQREVALLTQLRDGPNITKYYGCYLDGPRVWIVMELAQGGSVYSLMQSSPNNCLEEKYVVVIVREVLTGLNYLHKSNVIHRDIKAANILITASGKVMICDFGVSALLATTNSKRNTFIGTPYWMAPEVAQPVPAYDTKADIWSLGIMIYEMTKGSPPHFRVAHLKVIQMIPKVKPPRLAENEGSKDLRDFIPFTLTESPSDRLPAEELLKTKWIKSSSKTPVAILKDVLSRYDTWIRSGSKPSDLSEPLPWERESNLRRPEPDENPWEFETVRGRSFDASGLGSQATSSEDQASTVRPPQSKLPTSLRHLFDNDVGSAPDPFRIPGFSATGKDAVSGLPGSPALPHSPATPLPVARDRAARRALRIENSSPEDALNLSTATFAFPSRATPKAAKAKVGSNLPPPDDQVNPASPYPGHVDKLFSGPSSSLSETSGIESSPVPVPVPSKLLGRHDLRLDSGDPDLEVPSQGSGHEATLFAIANDDGPSADARLSPALSRRSPSSRSRSQSTTQGPPSTTGLDQNPPLPSDFHFPPYSSSSDSNQLVSSSPEVRHRARVSPTRAGTQISLHNSAHSLDARISAGSPRRLSPPSLAPPTLARSHSATPADDAPHDIHAGPFSSGAKPQRRPSLHRLASLTVIETPPSAQPTRPWSKFGRGRSGNSAGGVGDLSGIPDLKDVLKPCIQISNLSRLPPSHLNPSFVPSAGSYFPPANSSSSPFEKYNGVARSLPSPDLHSAFPPPASVSLPPVAHRRDTSLSSTHSPFPQIRNLDFGALMTSHEETHAELERIVDDLVQWLSIAESGMTRLLEKPSEDRIEEETEDIDNGADIGELESVDDEKNALVLVTR